MGNHSETGEVLEEALNQIKLKKRDKTPAKLNDENDKQVPLDVNVEGEKSYTSEERDLLD